MSRQSSGLAHSEVARAAGLDLEAPSDGIEILVEERAAACDLWHETGYVFTGQSLNPRTDHTNWEQLLERADVPERRLHDARHTAATVLLLLGATERTVMAVTG